MNTISQLANSNKSLTARETYTTPSSSYVVRRSLDKIIPQTGSSDYTPESTSRIAWRVPAGSFLDVNDLFFSFKMKAKMVVDDVVLTPTVPGKSTLDWNGAHTLFERMTITCGGVVVEDIQNINVLEQLIHKATDTADYVNSPIGKIQGLKPADGLGDGIADLLEATEYIFKPKTSGILTNDLMLPTPYLPEIVIELYLAKAPIVFKAVPIKNDDSSGTLTSIGYTLSDVALNAPYVEFDKDFITGFEASLQKNPLNYHFNTFSCFTQTVSNSSDVAIGSFRTDIKSLFTVLRNNTYINDPSLESFNFIRENVESYQVSLGTAKYPLEQVSVGEKQLAKNIVYATQALSNLRQNAYAGAMNCGRGAYGTDLFMIGLDLSNSEALLGGIDSTLTFGSPLMLQVKGTSINQCHMNSFVHYGSVLTILPDRSIVCTF